MILEQTKRSAKGKQMLSWQLCALNQIRFLRLQMSSKGTSTPWSSSTGARMTQNFRLKCVDVTHTIKQASGPFEGNTDHPFLFIANSSDNVTPLKSARITAAGFNGSRIMIQNSSGIRCFCTKSKKSTDFNLAHQSVSALRM